MTFRIDTLFLFIPTVIVLLVIGVVWRRPLDDLVQACAFDPHAAAVRAGVNLDSLAVAHLQWDTADITLCNCGAG